MVRDTNRDEFRFSELAKMDHAELMNQKTQFKYGVNPDQFKYKVIAQKCHWFLRSETTFISGSFDCVHLEHEVNTILRKVKPYTISGAQALIDEFRTPYADFNLMGVTDFMLEFLDLHIETQADSSFDDKLCLYIILIYGLDQVRKSLEFGLTKHKCCNLCSSCGLQHESFHA